MIICSKYPVFTLVLFSLFLCFDILSLLYFTSFSTSYSRFIQSCLKYLKYCLRMAFIITNNIYCIPTHLAWMTFFWPLKRYYITLWLAIESQLYEWLLTMVSIWCYSAGYNGKSSQKSGKLGLTWVFLPSQLNVEKRKWEL